MPRLYSVPMPAISVSAAQDLFQLTGAAGKLIRLKRIKVGDTDSTAPASQMLSFRVSLITGGTPGTGGGTATIARTDPGDAAATFTALRNNTTKATGTPTVVYTWGEHVFNGLDETYDGVVMRAPVVVNATNSYIVVELLSAPSPAITLSGFCEVEEEG